MSKCSVFSAALFFVSCSLGLCATSALAASGVVSGHIVDRNQDPLDKRVVRLIPRDGHANTPADQARQMDARPLQTTFTAADGSFRFNNVPGGGYLIVVGTRSRGTTHRGFTLEDGRTSVINLVLDENALGGDRNGDVPEGSTGGTMTDDGDDGIDRPLRTGPRRDFTDAPEGTNVIRGAGSTARQRGSAGGDSTGTSTGGGNSPGANGPGGQMGQGRDITDPNGPKPGGVRDITDPNAPKPGGVRDISNGNSPSPGGTRDISSGPMSPGSGSTSGGANTTPKRTSGINTPMTTRLRNRPMTRLQTTTTRRPSMTMRRPTPMPVPTSKLAK